MKGILSVIVVIFISTSSLLAQEWPVVKFQFRLKTDKLEFMFQEVAGLDSENQVNEYRGGNSKVYSTVKMPGIQKFSNVTLKKGMALNTNAKEMNSFLASKKRVPMTIELLDEQGKATMTWSLANAFVVKAVKVVNGNELAVESMEIAHEGFTIKK